jgi:hypothetical protein
MFCLIEINFPVLPENIIFTAGYTPSNTFYMSNLKEIRIENVSAEVVQDLKNVAKNYGTTLSALLKPKLREIRDSYPEKDRRISKD